MIDSLKNNKLASLYAYSQLDSHTCSDSTLIARENENCHTSYVYQMIEIKLYQRGYLHCKPPVMVSDRLGNAASMEVVIPKYNDT